MIGCDSAVPTPAKRSGRDISNLDAGRNLAACGLQFRDEHPKALSRFNQPPRERNRSAGAYDGTSPPHSNLGTDIGIVGLAILADCVEEEDPISRYAGNLSVLAGAVYLAGSLSISAMAQGVSPPDFAPNSSAGWFAYTRQFIPPASGAGPVRPDPAHRGVSNDEFRATGRQPALAVADLDNPILQPWARDKVRERNELVLPGKQVFSAHASC